MRQKIRGSVASQKIQIHKRERRLRAARIASHRATLAKLRSILAEKDRNEPATGLRRRIRTLEQQIRYMGGEL